jgi:transcriptional regulator with XRE-family HTH domain
MSIAQAAPGEAEPLSRVLEKIDTPWKPEEIVTALLAEKERQGIDDAALAERSLVTKSTLARWSEGRVRRPRAGAILKIAVGLDLLGAEELPKWRTAGAERRRRALVHRSRRAEQGAAEPQEPVTKPADDPSRSEELTALSNRVAHLEARAAVHSEEFAILAHRVAHFEARAAASTEDVSDLTRHVGHLGALVDQHVDETDRKLNELTEALVRSLTDKLGSHVLSNSKQLDALKESQGRNTQILESHGELLHKLTLRLIEFDRRPPSQHAWEDTLGTAVDIVLEVLKAKSEKGEE